MDKININADLASEQHGFVEKKLKAHALREKGRKTKLTDGKKKKKDVGAGKLDQVLAAGCRIQHQSIYGFHSLVCLKACVSFNGR